MVKLCRTRTSSYYLYHHKVTPRTSCSKVLLWSYMYSHHSSRLDYEFWSEGFPKRKEDERSTKRSNENWGAGWLGWSYAIDNGTCWLCVIDLWTQLTIGRRCVNFTLALSLRCDEEWVVVTMAETTAKRLHVERSDGMIEEFTDGGQQSSAALQPIKSFLWPFARVPPPEETSTEVCLPSISIR